MSRRFGSDKALALVEGRPMLARLAEAMRPCVAEITIVARREGQYSELGLRTIADCQPGLGPVGGLQAALHDASTGRQGDLTRGGWILVIAVDFVTLRKRWIEALGRAAHAPAQAVVFKAEHVEPLCAMYHTSALGAVTAAINDGERALHRLLRRLQTRYLPLPADWPRLAHVNTSEELRQALASAHVPRGQ